MANKTSAFRESAKKIGIYQPRSVDEANEMLNELETRSQGIADYLNSDKESSAQERIKYQDQITGARRQLETLSNQYKTDLSQSQQWYDEANTAMQDRKNAYVQRVMATQAQNDWAEREDNRTTVQKAIDKLLGVDRTKVTGGKTDWGQLAKGTVAKGANQVNSSFWSGVGIFNDIGKRITDSKIGNWLFGDLADSANALATTTINGAIDTINSIFGTNYGGIKNGQSALDFLVSDAQAGKANAVAKYDANANTSRAAQIIDQFGTSTIAAIPMAIEAAILAPTQAMQAAQVTSSGLSYFAGLQNAKGAEAVGMMAREGLNKLFKNPQFWTSYLQAAGDGYESAKEDGMSHDDAAVYALTNGFFNAMVEVGGADEALGGIQNFPMRLRQAAASGNKSAVVDWFKDSVLGEAWEEVQQGVLERGIKSFFGQDVPLWSTDPTDDRAIFNPYTAGQEFLGGAVVGGVLGGGQVAANSAAQSISDSRTFKGNANALIEAAKKSAQVADQARVAQIESAMAARKDNAITVGEARALLEIASRNGNMHAYAQAVLQQEKQRRAALAKENAQQQRVAKYMERVRAGEVDETGTADTKNATVEYQGRQAKIDFVRDGNENRIRLTFDDGSEKTVSYQEAEEAGLDEDVKNLITALSAIGPNAPAAYSVYESSQEVGKYAAAMDEAINLYAAQGQDVRQAAKAAKEAGSTALITYLNDAQLEMAQSLGAKIYEQKQTQVKEAGAKLKQIRQQAQEAMNSQNKTAAEGLAAVNTTLAEAREHYKTIRAAYDQTVEYLEEMAANGQQDTEAYQNALEQANYLRSDLEGTQNVISSLEAERKKLQAQQPIKRKKGTVSFDGATDGKTTFDGVDPSKLNKKQSAVVNMVKSLADVLDIDFVFFQGPAGTGGFYRGGNTIYININSGMGVGDFNNVIAAGSLSHELTHWLQEYAPEEYEALRQFIVNDIIEKQGADAFERLVQQQTDWEKGRLLSRDKAIDEVVANACQTMLRDSNAITELAQQNKSLAEKIRDFIQDLIDRIKAAFEDVDISNKAHIYDAARAIQGEYEDILKLWDDALRAAAETGSAVRAMETETQEEMPAAAQRVQAQAWGVREGVANERLEPIEGELLNSITNTDSNVIVDSHDKVVEIVNDVFDNPNKKKTAFFGILNKDVLSEIQKKATNVPKDLQGKLFKENRGYVLAATYDSIRHLNDDQNLSREDIVELLDRMADIVIENDTVKYTTYEHNKQFMPGLLFEKAFSDGSYGSYNLISGGRRRLGMQTMYIEGRDSTIKKKPSYTMPMNKPRPTSETKGSQASIDTISEATAPVKQEISSAATSINASKLPALFTNKNAVFKEGGTNVDIGGGRFDNVTEYLSGKGVTNFVFDPYNRPEDTNQATLRFLMDGNRADTATCANVLNVIREQAARDNVILEAAKTIKPDGKAYFIVYEGDGSGKGRVTKSGWQENRKTASYESELRKYFDKVTPKGKLLIAENPKADLPKAAWETTPGKATRFQMWDTVEETDKLVAVHNKSVSGLRRMLDRNGVPFPSIAIKKAGTSHEGFGDVSIVFPRSTIDPEVNRQNRLYSNDAWTPTEPVEEYDVGDMWRFQKKFKNMVGDEIYSGLHGGSYLEESDLERKLQYSRGDVFAAVKDQPMLKYAYLKSIGQEPTMPTTQERLDGFGRYKNEQLLAVFSALTEEEISSLDFNNEEMLQRVADILEDQFESQFDEQKREKLRKHPVYTAEKVNPNSIKDAFKKYRNAGYKIETVPDYYTFDRDMRYNISLEEDPGYKAWIEEQFKDLILGHGIPNGKDLYTSSGNRRSFKARHIPATLENIVAQMQKEQERGNGVMGINLRGAATKSYRNVEEMRAESGKLLGKHIADDVYDSYMKGFYERLHGLSETATNGNQNSWEGLDSTEEILLTALRDARSKQNMDTLLQREARWIKYSPELTEKLWQLREDVQNMPAPYFEAKPRRVVYPGEALAYILPDNADQDVVDRLNDLGYRVLTYKAGDEADRLDKLNSIQEARFQQWGNQDQMSMWDGPEQISLDEWMNGSTQETTNVHPRIRSLLDRAAATEQKVRDFFTQIPEDSEYYLDPDEIDDMMEVDPFGSAYDGYMYNAEQLVMNLSELSKGMQGAAKEQAYELMDELLGYLSTSQAANWKEDRLTENKTFTEWYNRKHPSMYYPGYVPGKFLKYEEKRYLQNGIRNGIFTGEELAEAQRKLAAIDDPASGTWYQKWDDFDPDDFATETQERKESYTRIQAEDVTLAEAIAGLNAAIAKQKTTIGKIQERLKLGRTQETRESDAMKLAKHLLAKHGSTADPNRVAAELKALGDYLLQTKKVDQDELKQRARVVAADIIENAEQEAEPTGEEQIYREIADNIKGKKLTIDSKDLGELDEVGGYDSFRRANFGRFTLAKRTKNGEVKEGYETVESAYRALQATYGTAYFPDMQGKTEGDLIQTMASFFDLAEPEIVNPYESFKGEAIEETANSIVADALDGILRPVSTEATTKQQAKELGKQIEAGEQGAVNLIAAAQKIAEAYETADSRVEALKLSIELLKKQEGKANEKELEALRETVYDLTIALDKAESHYRTLQKSAEARMAQIRAEGRARQTEIRAEAKAKANAAAAKHYKEMAKRARERRKENAGAAKYRAKIQQQAKKLSDWLMKNSDKEHIPEAIKAPLISFLSSLDFTSKRALNGGAQTQNDMKFGARLQKLQQMLANQQSYLNGDGTVQEDLGGYIDIGQDMLQFLRDMAQKATDEMSTGNYYTINRMSATELKDLSNLLASLTTSIRNMNNLMANARYETVRQAASQDIEEMERLGQAADRESKGIWKFLKWKDATPYYAMKRLGRGAQSIFDGLTRGWEKLAFHAQEIIDFTEKTYTDKEVNEWKKEIHNIELSDGSRIRMTTAQIMELAMLYNRDQAQKHLRAGGLRIGNIEYKKGTITDTKHYHLTAEDINKLFDMLTSRQLEVAYKLQKFMANKGAEWGNEISMRRFGYNFYTEGENYYPIRTDSNDRAMRDTDAQENSMFRLLNLSSSKSLNPKASNALVVGDIFDTFADHMADQAKLNALGLPILDGIKWFNFKERIDLEDGTYDTRTLQAAMEQAFGSEAQHYFRTLMKDINGVTESGDRGTNLASRMMSNYKIASVGANLRVAMLQPTAYVRAQTVISPRNLLRAFAYKNGYKEALKYSGTAVWKSMGYYDTNISRNMRQQIQHNETVRDKIVETSMKLAEHGDQVTWGRIWVACKLQAQEMNPELAGDALIQETANLFRQVVYSSQVMDSTLTRSELMRSHSFWDKNLTAFMAEPTLSYNILLDAYSEYEKDVRERGKQGAWQRNSDKILKAITVYESSAIVAAIAESIADAIRDDDDDESALDKFLQAFLGEDSFLDGNLFQDVLLTGKIPYAKNIWSLLQGYDNSDMVFGGISNLIKVFEIWKETVQLATGDLDKATKTTYYGNMTTWGKVYKTLQSLSQVSGFPVSGMMRDVFAIWNATAGSIVPYWKIKTYDKNHLSQGQKNAWAENLKGLGISEGQYQRMRTEMDADGNGSLKQDEVGAYLDEQVKFGNLTKEQADAIWASAGTTWKKTYSQWRGDPEPAAATATETAQTTRKAAVIPTITQEKITTYDQFKKAAHIYSDNKEEAFSLWESTVKPLGIDLDRYTQYINVSDTDENGSVKQDELGKTLTNEIYREQLSLEQARAIWKTLWNGPRSKTYDKWAASKGF